MLFGAFLSWWYGRGWMATLDQAVQRNRVVVELFSIPILFKTLFSPWKQIVTVSTSDKALNDRIKSALDNAISRLVGFFVRFIVMMVGVISIALATSAGLIWILAWPLLPLMIPLLIVFSTGFAQ